MSDVARLPLRRKLLFSALAIALVGGVLELALRLAGVEPLATRDDDPWVGFTSRSPVFVEDAEGQMTTAPARLRFFNPQRFRRDKAPGVQRIFCLGGSTTYGRPYDHRTAFCAWLDELLRQLDAGPFEVINAGGISYASYRVALVQEELAEAEPDLFVLYTGHNEFLEARTYAPMLAVPAWVRTAGALAARSRSASLVARGLGVLVPSADGEDAGETTPDTAGRGRPDREGRLLGPEVETLLDRSIGPDAYHRDDAFARDALQHFRFNLRRMIAVARKSGAEILLVTPAANLRGMSPFKSEPSVAGAAAERWREAYEAGSAALEAGEIDRAVAALTTASRAEARHAETWYRLGRALDASGRFPEALEAYRRARDEDVCPLRAPGPFVEAVREIAADEDVGLVDFERWVHTASPEGIPGSELFLDHVHPTLDGHRELALSLLGALRERGVIPVSTRPSAADLAAVDDAIRSALTPERRARSLLNLSKVLGWAGKLTEARSLAEEAAEAVPADPEARIQAAVVAQLAGDVAAAVSGYRRALGLGASGPVVHGNLAAALEELGRIEEAVAHYRVARELEPRPERDRNLATALRLAAEHRRSAGSSTAAAAAAAEADLVLGQGAALGATTLTELGAERLGAGDPGAAVTLLRAALDAAPPGPSPTRQLLVSALLAAGNPAAAENLLRRGLADRSADPVADRILLGSLLYRSGRVLEAVGVYEEALALDPARIEAASNLAWILATSADAEIRDPGGALHWARIAAEGSGGDPWSVDVLAAAEAAAGRFDRAAALATRAREALLRVDPASARAVSERLDLYRSGTPLRIPGPSDGGS